MKDRPVAPAASRFQIALAFFAVYVIWSSTYLAIRIAVETLPPFLMASARFLIAGVALFGWTALRGAPRPTKRNWLAATAVGGLLLLCGNGGVVWAEQRVPSGLTAVLIATVPLWMQVIEWTKHRGRPPSVWVAGGVLVGLSGVAFLVGLRQGRLQVDVTGALVLVLAAFAWAAGSLYSRTAPLPASPLQATALEMLVGGGLMLLAGTVMGEWGRVTPQAMTFRAVTAVVYLAVFGSLVGFTAYVWLLQRVTFAAASTYAYVNPMVALFLGWLFLGEPVSHRVLLATGIIIGSVIVILNDPSRRSNAKG